MASMMGCLGVWVTDAIEPEELGDCVTLTYPSSGLNQHKLKTDSIITIDWAGENIKSYPIMTSEEYVLYTLQNAGDVKIYNPEHILVFAPSSYPSLITGLEYLTAVEDLQLTISQANLTIPDGLDAINIIEITCSSAVETLTFAAGNASMVQLFMLGYGANNLNSITLPTDLVNLAWFNIDYAPSLTTITIPSEWVSISYLYIKEAALTEATVNQILITLDTNGSSPAAIDLSGGTSAAPTGLGLAAKTSLEGKGVGVTTN